MSDSGELAKAIHQQRPLELHVFGGHLGAVVPLEPLADLVGDFEMAGIALTDPRRQAIFEGRDPFDTGREPLAFVVGIDRLGVEGAKDLGSGQQ